jgi:hypothetical protein
MKMIAHEAIRMDLKAGFLAGLRQSLEEILSIHIVQENVLAAISATHEVVDGPLILHSHFARHSSEPADSRVPSQTKTNYGLTPYAAVFALAHRTQPRPKGAS